MDSSSSSSHITDPNFHTQISREDEEKQRNWLQLGLGLGFASTKSNCTLSNSYLSLSHHDLGLGLGLGYKGNSTAKEIIAPSSSFHCNDDNDNVSADVPSLSLPFHMEEDDRLLSKLAITNHSHDYLSSRSTTKSAGLWFTLHSSTNW